MINIPYKQLNADENRIHPALQFLIFLLVTIVALLIGTAIGIGIIWVVYGFKTVTAVMNLTVAAPSFVNALWILQFAGTTFPIFAIPVFFAYVVVQNPTDYIKTTFRFPWVLLIMVFVITMISSPLIEFLTNINEKMVLPHFLKWMRDDEDNAQKLTAVMLQMKTIWSMIFDVLFIGLLTAIVEEFMFRGCLQTIFERWTKNTHAAIWITAILFSAFHMEFFGFLPRMLLGVLFGYFVAYSGSVWTSVWAHFINNGTAVIVTYLYQHKLTSISPDDRHVFNYTLYILSFIIVIFLFWVYRDIALKKPVQQ